MTNIRLVRGDSLDVLRTLPDSSVDAVVTDPPYGLAELPRRVVETALRAWLSGDRDHVPDGRGFMGKGWDAFVPPPAVWDECFRVLKPGGHLVAFAGSRTYDLMGISIRLAGLETDDRLTGFEVRDGLMWLYGSGFPKGINVGKAIDKARDDRPDIVRVTAWLAEQRDRAGRTNRQLDDAFGTNGMAGHWTSVKSQPAVPTWDQWLRLRELLGFGDEMDAEVWRLNGRKGTPGEAWSQREVVGQGHRVRRVSDVQIAGLSDGAYDLTAPHLPEAAQWDGWNTALKPAHEPIVLARRPLSGTVARNVLEYGTGALNVDACRVGAEQRTNHAGGASSLQRVSRVEQGYRDHVTTSVGEASAVTGRWPANVLLSHGPECNGQCAPGCPVAELDAQSGVTTSPAGVVTQGGHRSVNGLMNATGEERNGEGVGYGDTGGASRFFPVFDAAPFRYQAKAPSKERPRVEVDGKLVGHPTVKPLAVMAWLVRLVCPGGVVLDPFAGSGTTGQAARDEGMASILIDRDTRWAQARLDMPAEEFAGPEPEEDPMPQVAAAPGMQIESATAQPRNPAGKSADDWEDFPRDQWGRPLVPRAEPVERPGGRTDWIVPKDAAGNPIKELVPFRRSSSLGGAVEYQENLGRWRALVACFGIVRSPKLAKRMRAIPDYATREYKDEGYEVVKLAQEFAEIHSAADHGTALHTLAVRIARGETDVTVDEDDQPAIEAFRRAMTRFQVISCEQRVICDEAQAAGRYDILVTPLRPMPVTDKRGQVVDVIMPGELIIVDIKTSSTADYFGPKFAVQLWTYDKGRILDRETGERTEQGPEQQGANHRWALILHMPSGGDSADWHWVNLVEAEPLVHLANDVLAGRNLGKRIIGRADLDAEIPADLLDQAANRGLECATHGPHPGTVDCAECIYAEPPLADQLAEDPSVGVPPVADRCCPDPLVAEVVDAKTSRTGPAVYSPLVAEAGGSGFIDPAACETCGLCGKHDEECSANEAAVTAQIEQVQRELDSAPMPSAGAPPIREDLAGHLQNLERDRLITRTIKDARDVDMLVAVYDRLVELGLWPGPWKALLTEARQDIESGRRFARATGPTE